MQSYLEGGATVEWGGATVEWGGGKTGVGRAPATAVLVRGLEARAEMVGPKDSAVEEYRVVLRVWLWELKISGPTTTEVRKGSWVMSSLLS